jgi:1-deoxy-D-xylulose-5-phosphate reductoisomerase
MKNIVLLGSTGSIGTSTIKVAEDLPQHIRLIGLAAGRRVDDLVAQAGRFKPQLISISDPALKESLDDKTPKGIRTTCGKEGLLELATLPEADIILIAIVGTAGLEPALAAIRAGKDIAVASKEILVMAGEIVMREAKAHGVRVLAVDSEHSAIFQCLDDKPESSVRALWLTASGGPFREKPKEEFASIRLDQALKHPSWEMGRKITIDSATLFNKGLEMIEARWLFDIEMPRVKVIVHPQSIVHSMVEFVDGSIISQLSTPNMCLPIQYALTYPERIASDRVQTDFAKIATLTFEEPDTEKFPSINLAREAGTVGGTLPAVLNAANEVAVEAFCQGQLDFPGITEVVAETMDTHQTNLDPSLDEILEADQWARQNTEQLVSK